MNRPEPLLLPLAALLTGCASASFAPRIDAIGEYRDTTAASKRADDMRAADAEDVRVLVGQLPDGVRIDHETLSVDPARYALVGRVSADFKPYGLTWLGLWFYDYPETESWRNVYCGVQVPLTWVTFAVWPFVSPLHYPCKVVEGSSPSEAGDRRTRIIQALQKATKAAGGDLLVVTALGDLHLVSEQGVVLSTVPLMHGSGFALRTKAGRGDAEAGGASASAARDVQGPRGR